MLNEMSTEDMLDTKKSISQEDTFVVIESTNTSTNGNLNNGRDSSLGVPKQLHSPVQNGCGCNAGNFGHAECTENSSQAAIEHYPLCRLPLAKKFPNRDCISQVFIPETQNTYNSASKTINQSSQSPLCYNDSVNTLSYLQTKKRSLSRGRHNSDRERRVKCRNRSLLAPLDEELGIKNELGSIPSALSSILMSAILL